MFRALRKVGIVVAGCFVIYRVLYYTGFLGLLTSIGALMERSGVKDFIVNLIK